jgi:hypothetical protein
MVPIVPTFDPGPDAETENERRPLPDEPAGESSPRDDESAN